MGLSLFHIQKVLPASQEPNARRLLFAARMG